MKRILALSILLAMLTPVHGFAEDAVIEIDAKIIRSDENGHIKQEMVVWGGTSASLWGRKIGLAIARPGAMPEGDGDDFSKYAALYQGYIGDDGEYEFRFLFEEEEGEYTLRIKADTCEEVFLKTVYISAVDNIRNLLSGLENKLVTAASLQDSLDNDSRNLGVDVSIYQGLDDTVKRAICENVTKNLTAYTIDGFTGLLNLKIILIGLSQTADVDFQKQILSYYERDYIKLKENPLYSNYDGMSDALKNQVIGGLYNKNLSGIDELNTCFYDNVFLTQLSELSSHTQLGALISEYKNHLKIESQASLAEGMADTKKRAVYAYIMENRSQIKTGEKFIDLFKYALSNVDNLTKNDNTPPGGGGGGGGSIVSVAPTLENVQPPVVLPDGSFTDLGGFEWARKAILDLYEKKIVTGREVGRFYPEGQITRAEFVKIITELLGIVDEGAVCQFDDVMPGDWAYKYIASAGKRGIITGVSENIFGAEALITRQDIATIIYRVLISVGKMYDFKTIKNNFSDFASVSEYAKNGVLILQNLDIISGYEDGTFRPFEFATRAEAAVLIYNFAKLL